MKLFLLKLKTSLAGALKILAIPSYGLLATMLALVIMWIFLWLFNLELLFSVVSSATLDLYEKLAFCLAGFQSLFTNFDSLQAGSLAIFAVLSGINLSVLVFVLRHGATGGASGTQNFFAAAGALIGSGCAVCGGSILAPLAALFGSTLSIAATQAIGTAANLIGIGLLLYSIYGLGKSAAQIQAKASNAFKL